MAKKKTAPPAHKMLTRTRSDGVRVYWSRMGWSDVYAMALTAEDAQFRKNELCNNPGSQFKPEQIQIVSYRKVSAR